MKSFKEFPKETPETPLLDSLNELKGLSSFSNKELIKLADELREFLLYSTNISGGHFGAGLGVIELTVALHHVFNTPKDKIIWDVGHQAYPHKILTGRKDRMITIRQKDGLDPFPSRGESTYDSFGVGHSSTSISAALGMALAGSKENKYVSMKKYNAIIAMYFQQQQIKLGLPLTLDKTAISDEGIMCSRISHILYKSYIKVSN